MNTDFLQVVRFLRVGSFQISTYISNAHNKFSSCIQNTFFFSTLNSDNVDFTRMSSSRYEFAIGRETHCPRINFKKTEGVYFCES